jgi:hypothetical protein
MKISSVVLAAVLSLGIFMVSNQVKKAEPVILTPEIVAPKKVERPLSTSQKKNFAIITDTYNVSEVLVKDVLHYVDKHADKVFPRREDILAIIGIESSWNPKARSNLKYDPALGLTQIRPKTWSSLISHPDELNVVENQIRYAAKILKYQYRLTKDKDAAIIAYNAGYGNWLNGNYGFDYLLKFKEELSRYQTV